MKNVINLDKERKRKEKKVLVKRVRESLRKSIIADLKVKYGNKIVESNIGQINTQIEGIIEEYLGKANG